MINKSFGDKLKLIVVIVAVLFLIIPKGAMAAEVPKQMEHKVSVPADKVWNIKFNRAINVDNLSKKVMVYKPSGLSEQVSVSCNTNTITVKPPKDGYIAGQTYSLQIYETITDVNANPLKRAVIMNFTIAVPYSEQRKDSDIRQYNYVEYGMTLEQIVDKQSKVNPSYLLPKFTIKPSNADISAYVDPKNFENDDYGIYQFLTLNYIEGITADEIDDIFKAEGILKGQGKVFLDACKKYDVNPAYSIAHAILETGHGNSALANGILVSEVNSLPVESKLTYNMFGIGAYDANANKFGSERAYTLGWFTPELAIDGGIKYISTDYINKSTNKQNTLYKIRWNPATPATHQYATDITWAYKQISRIKEILDKCKNANLIFEIPQYK